MYIELLCIL